MTINSIDHRRTNQKNVANKTDDVASVVVYKYSNDRKGPLHESIILAGVPMFIKYEDGHVKADEHIDEASRIISPHRKEGYPYPPYEFNSVEEVQEYVNKAKSTNIESLYLKAKEIVLKYIDEEDKDKLKTLKHTYEYNSRIPKVNMNTKDQNQNWFYGYCYKIIISEKPLNSFKAKGLVERTLTFHCKPATESIQSIKEITTNPPGHSEKQELYKELMDFRRLMLCYRLIHYMDHIPDIDTGLKNRDQELGGPLLRLFHDTKVLGEIKYALHKFLAQRKARKEKTLESALQPLIVRLLTDNNSNTLELSL
jgi:hypothetical protein